MGPGRLLLLGDTHGDSDTVAAALELAAARHCDTVVQLGDFGWWPHTRSGRYFAETVDELTRDAEMPLVFVGGNHENWESLEELESHGGRDEDGFVVLGDQLRYVPRPHRWTWSGLAFGALGGAWSIDQRRRSPYISWWPQEQPTGAQARELVDGGPLDVLVCHDAPFGVDLSQWCVSGNDADGDPSTRRLLQHVVDECRPSLVVHGHWHLRHTTVMANGTVVEGLAHQAYPAESRCAVLELDGGATVVTPPGRPALLRG